MQQYLDQAAHNIVLYQHLESSAPDSFSDWKITLLFYTALHYLKALAMLRNKNIGDTHFDIENNTNPDRPKPVMSITRNAWADYKNLFRYSQQARYDGFTDFDTFEELMKDNLVECKKHFDSFKKYIKGQGVPIM